ncbi:MAG: hypothetical protein R3B06_00920 [Kofleriaceae bacterium]
MSPPAAALGAWWSIVQVDATALTVVVVVVAAAALGFVGRRVWQRRR